MRWEVKTWNDVLTIVNGKNQKAVENPDGQYPIYGSGGIMGYADDYICPEYCTIIGRKGSINRPIFVETKFWNVDTAFGLKANPELLLPRFLYYFCVNYDFLRHNKATTLPSLVKSDLLKIEIPLPPLPTQQRIVAELDKINELIADHLELIRQLDALEQALFYDTFGDPIENPRGWQCEPWENLFDTILGKMLDQKKQNPEDKSLPYLANQNVQWGYFNLDNLNTMTFSQAEINKLTLKDGDIIICEGGEAGRCAIWHNIDKEILFQKALHRARIKDLNKLNPYFVRYWLEIYRKNDGLKNFIVKSTIEHLTGMKLKKVLVPLPPLPLQTAFAERIEAIERRKGEAEQAIAELRTLLEGRMDYWFH